MYVAFTIDFCKSAFIRKLLLQVDRNAQDTHVRTLSWKPYAKVEIVFRICRLQHITSIINLLCIG